MHETSLGDPAMVEGLRRYAAGDNCTDDPGVHDAWPPDFNMDGACNVLDIVRLTPPMFNTVCVP